MCESGSREFASGGSQTDTTDRRRGALSKVLMILQRPHFAPIDNSARAITGTSLFVNATVARTVMETSMGMQWVDVLLESHPQMADFKCPL